MANNGNCAAMREALEYVKERIGSWWEYLEVSEKVESALASPPRNCDVGTADEQAERYRNFTDRYNPCAYRGYAICSEDCPVHVKLTQEGHGELQCQLEWAQMPYEEAK